MHDSSTYQCSFLVTTGVQRQHGPHQPAPVHHGQPTSGTYHRSTLRCMCSKHALQAQRCALYMILLWFSYGLQTTVKSGLNHHFVFRY